MKVIDGDYLASSLNLIILRKQLSDIREMMHDIWEEHEKTEINIPEWQRPITDTFDYMLSQFIQNVKRQGKFHELANEAAGHCLLKRMIELKNSL